MQYTKRTVPFFEDFSAGLSNKSFLIPTGYKGCCASNISDNFDVVYDDVNGVHKPVLAINAFNRDNAACGTTANESESVGGSAACAKVVSSAGAIITSDIFASGSYSVIAKVPQAPGLIWAVWLYHYELHVPQ